MKVDQGTQIAGIAKQQHTLEEHFKKHAQQSNQDLEFLRQEQTMLQQTVQSSLLKQENKLTQTFEDIKALLTAQRGTKRATAEPQEHEEMESEGGLL